MAAVLSARTSFKHCGKFTILKLYNTLSATKVPEKRVKC